MNLENSFGIYNFQNYSSKNWLQTEKQNQSENLQASV